MLQPTSAIESARHLSKSTELGGFAYYYAVHQTPQIDSTRHDTRTDAQSTIDSSQLRTVNDNLALLPLCVDAAILQSQFSGTCRQPSFSPVQYAPIGLEVGTLMHFCCTLAAAHHQPVCIYPGQSALVPVSLTCQPTEVSSVLLSRLTENNCIGSPPPLYHLFFIHSLSPTQVPSCI